jgi:hypothetical protein
MTSLHRIKQLAGITSLFEEEAAELSPEDAARIKRVTSFDGRKLQSAILAAIDRNNTQDIAEIMTKGLDGHGEVLDLRHGKFNLVTKSTEDMKHATEYLMTIEAVVRNSDHTCTFSNEHVTKFGNNEYHVVFTLQHKMH